MNVVEWINFSTIISTSKLNQSMIISKA